MPFSVRLFRRLLLAYFSGFMSLITLLLLNSGPAYAEWVAVGSTENATVYVDPDTIRRKGDLVKMWEMFDYTTRQTVADTSHLSSKAQAEFDCVEERTRLLALTEFSAIREAVKWCGAVPTKASGVQLSQKVLIELCGKLPATRSDR